MSKKLTKKDCSKKIKHHEKRISFYKKKKDIEKEKRRIGFRF